MKCGDGQFTKYWLNVAESECSVVIIGRTHYIFWARLMAKTLQVCVVSQSYSVFVCSGNC